MLAGDPYLNTLLLLIISYFLGSSPSAFIAGKIKKMDIRYADLQESAFKFQVYNPLKVDIFKDIGDKNNRCL